MTDENRPRDSLRESSIFVGILTASLTSGVGIVVNIATQLVSNVIAWVVVAVLTLASGGTAAWASKSRSNKLAEVIEERLDEVPKLLQGEKRSASRRVSKGVVKRVTIEIRPDGTRLQTIEFFSESIAREDKNQL